jgi:hypothetical protein
MSRVQLAVTSAALSALALLAAPGEVVAQVGCQPTITQPCNNVPPRTSAAAPKNNARADDDNDREPKDHSPRIKLDNDTDFKFGTGGIGLGRKF